MASSFILAAALVIFAVPIAKYLGEPQLFKHLRYLGIIIIFKAISTTLQSILAGLRNYKIIAQNNIISGIVMQNLCVTFTIYVGLYSHSLFLNSLIRHLIHLLLMQSVLFLLQKV